MSTNTLLAALFFAVFPATTNCQSSAVGVNIKPSIPVLDELLGSSDTPHEKRYGVDRRALCLSVTRSLGHALHFSLSLSLCLSRSCACSFARWYFWVIIGVIACFMIVTVYFTVRGLRRYRHVYLNSASNRQTRFDVDVADAARRTAAGVCPDLRMKYNPRYAHPHARQKDVV